MHWWSSVPLYLIHMYDAAMPRLHAEAQLSDLSVARIAQADLKKDQHAKKVIDQWERLANVTSTIKPSAKQKEALMQGAGISVVKE